MIVRPMLPIDVDRVIEIADSLEAAPRWPRDLYRAALNPGSAPHRVALVAEDARGRIVGFLVAAIVLEEAELETIGVTSDWQRQGAAKAMLQELFRDLEELGATKLHLEVRKSNAAAQSLYRWGGFEVIGSRASYYTDPKEDAILMSVFIASSPVS